MDIISLESTGKLIALIASLFATFKAFNELTSRKTDKLRSDFDFAEKIIADNKWKNMHDFLLERGYWALSGTQLKATEIRFLLTSKNPLSKFQDYKKATRYVECYEVDEEGVKKTKIRFKIYFNEKKRKNVKWVNLIGYVFYASLAFLPIIFVSNITDKSLSSLLVVFIWLSSFGFMAFLCLQEYSHLNAANRLMGEGDDS
ncbi:hypothetical protein [Vibrio nitrifigilis]|uniref:DUF4231 domain-containing protein n=1 Tax=Vibrio nitrifigilis TaxID=2789781 RepID=A0ABS0GE17_9VIBR|nr:hypothetical protein [Vibrio nitrifigilis]MBF9000649.1 hypothetical protein [Vibrio nitrifigilis]